MRLPEILPSLIARLESRDVVFPTSVQVALRLKGLLENPDCHIEQAARLIGAEPLLASRVIAVANSVAYNRAGREITDIRSAVSRLGFATLRTLTMTLIARQLAQDTTGTRHALADALWQHTAQVAALAHALARHVTRVDPEAAMFAGVVHEIGGFYLLSQLPADLALDAEDLAEWMEHGQAELGRAVIAHLDLPASIREALAAYWDGFLALPPGSLADTLLLAEALASTPSPLSDASLQPAEVTSGEIELLVGSDTLSQIVAEADEEIRSLVAALQA